MSLDHTKFDTLSLFFFFYGFCFGFTHWNQEKKETLADGCVVLKIDLGKLLDLNHNLRKQVVRIKL